MGQELIENWKDYLPRGTMQKIARKFNISRQTVWRVIRDENCTNRPEVIEEAMRIANLYKKKEKQFNEQKDKIYGT